MAGARRGMSAAEDTERFAVVIFNNRSEREDFVERLGLERSGRYITAAQLQPHLK